MRKTIEKRDNCGARIDDQLPGVRIAEKRAGRRPADDDDHGHDKSPPRPDKLGGPLRDVPKEPVHYTPLPRGDFLPFFQQTLHRRKPITSASVRNAFAKRLSVPAKVR